MLGWEEPSTELSRWASSSLIVVDVLISSSLIGTFIGQDDLKPLNCILGFHVSSQALLKLVSAMLVSLGCQIYANNRPFLQ